MKTYRTLIATILSAGFALGLALPLGAGATSTNPPELVSTFAGDGNTATLDAPRSVAPAPGGGYLIADTLNNRVVRVSASGATTTVAGTGTAGFNGDGLPATATQLNEPTGVAATADGGFLIADSHNNRVRKVLPGLGVVTTVAGTGTAGYSGDGLAATLAKLDHPSAVAPTPDGGFLIAEENNHTVRKVSALGIIQTVAGDGSAGYAGDGGQATSAWLSSPQDVAVTADGGFLIADTGNHAVRKVGSDGNIATVAGTGVAGYSGDGGAPLSAQLDTPTGVGTKSNDAFLIADSGNHVVRKVKFGVIKTTVGDSNAGFAGDGGDPDNASLNSPTDVLDVGTGELIADSANNRVRLVGTLPLVGSGSDGDSPLKHGDPALPAVDSSPVTLPKPEPPKVGQHFKVENKKGRVMVKLPNLGHFIDLDASASVPVGAVISTTKGKVALTAASNSTGGTQTANFSGGTFKVTQKRAAKPVTELTMRGGDFRPCWRRRSASRAGRAMAAATWKGRARRRLWGSGRGRFRTRGRHGAATVRGTVWLTQDSCAGTRVYVRRGLVAVRDFKRKRTVMVKKRHSYLARAHALKTRGR